mgnify:CR=1 FL=1
MVFVHRALRGEDCDILLLKVLKNAAFGKVTAIFGSVYNHVTGYFGDILSYSRLMTLMLAGSVIASVFNTLGAIPGNVVIFLIISALGNGLNFALNLLSCYVHRAPCTRCPRTRPTR